VKKLEFKPGIDPNKHCIFFNLISHQRFVIKNFVDVLVIALLVEEIFVNKIVSGIEIDISVFKLSGQRRIKQAFQKFFTLRLHRVGFSFVFHFWPIAGK